MKKQWQIRTIRIATLFLLFFSCFAQAQQPLKVGTYEDIHLETPHPYPAGTKEQPVVWRYILRHPGATYLSVHFKKFHLAPGDRVIIRGLKGLEKYEFTGKGVMDAGTFWATHINDDAIEIMLLSTNREPGYGFIIDRYAHGFRRLDVRDPLDENDDIFAKKPFPEPKAICAPDDKKNAICYANTYPDEYNKARAVARLLINGSSLCTGSLISCQNHFITNNHCIATQSDATNTDYEFMAEAPNCGDANCQLCFPGVKFTGGTLLATDAPKDYALIQITSGDPQATYGYIKIDNRTAVVDEQIFIPQHPGGRAKEFGIESSHSSDASGRCEVFSTNEPACQTGGPPDVGYYCDTEGGSSGSPVLAVSNLRMIALHHCANCPNRGVPITSIMQDIGSLLPACSTTVGPHMKTVSQTIQDSCGSGGGGGNNGIVEPGETVTLPVTAKNDGDVDLTNISGTLSTTTAGITVTDNSATWPDLTVGSTAQSNPNHFQFTVDPTVSCGTTIQFDMNYTYTQGNNPDTFQIQVGSTNWTTLLSEDFAAGIPASWTVVDGGSGGGAASTWTTANPGNRTIGAPFADPWAIVDSDNAGTTATQDEQLITPVINASSCTTVRLEFSNQFRWYSGGGNEIADVDVSINGGPWQNVLRMQGGSDGYTTPNTKSIDISSLTAGQANVRVRFYYYQGNYDWWWAIDNVVIQCGTPICTVCSSPPGEPGKASGQALKLSKSGTNLVFTWGGPSASCSGTSFALYEGDLSTLNNGYNHNTQISCSATSGMTVPLASVGSSAYFIVVAFNSTTEGSYGRSATGTGTTERPQSTNACKTAQDTTPC